MVVSVAQSSLAPTLLAGWVASTGLTFALPLAVVRGIVAVLERLE